MEKKITLTGAEVAKWIAFLVVILSAFIANQMDIRYLKKENEDRIEEIRKLKDEQKDAGNQAAAMNEKLTQIYNDVTLIKNAVINNQLNPHR